MQLNLQLCSLISASQVMTRNLQQVKLQVVLGQ